VVSRRTECREGVTERGTREGEKEEGELGTVTWGMLDAGVTEKKKEKKKEEVKERRKKSRKA